MSAAAGRWAGTAGPGVSGSAAAAPVVGLSSRSTLRRRRCWQPPWTPHPPWPPLSTAVHGWIPAAARAVTCRAAPQPPAWQGASAAAPGPKQQPAPKGPPAASGSNGSEPLPALTKAEADANVEAFLATLSEEQRAAALCPAKHVRVIAGPGSGKTRVVTARVANLLRSGIPPRAILTIAFTNLAANELKERLGGLLGPAGVARLRVMTFHSLCASILGRHAALLDPGLQDFLIYEPSDSAGCLLRALKRTPQVVAAGRGKATAVMSKGEVKKELDLISKMKNHVQCVFRRDAPGKQVSAQRLLGYEVMTELVQAGVPEFQDMPPNQRAQLEKLYDLYCAQLASEGALDFDDLLHATGALLSGCPEVQEKCHKLWQHILVDESQDTNRPQYELVSLLLGPNTSLFAVGDPNQGIYYFRGSNPDHLTGETGNWEGLTTLYLRDNYRSQPPIVLAGERLLLRSGVAPTLYKGAQALRDWTGSAGGMEPCVHLWSTPHANAEADVGLAIVRRAIDEVESLNDIAILYRQHRQADMLEARLRKAEIPYVRQGTRSFWDTKEISTALALLRLAASPNDTAALLDVIGSGLPITAGLGDKTIEKAAAWCKGADSGNSSGAVGGDAAEPRPTVAGAVLGDGWGGALELPASPAAAAALMQRVVSLPWSRARREATVASEAAFERSIARRESSKQQGASAASGGGAKAEKCEEVLELEAVQADDISDLEAFWSDLEDLAHIPVSAWDAELPDDVAKALMKGKQGKVVRRLRGLVALARAVAGSRPPADVIQVLLRASGFHLFLESWELDAAAARGKSGARRDASDRASSDAAADESDNPPLVRRFENLEELSALASKARVYDSGPRRDILDDDDESEAAATAAMGVDDPVFFLDGDSNGALTLEGGQPAAGVVVGGGGGGVRGDGVPVGLDALRQFVDYGKLASGDDADELIPKVRLMTLHAAKGKEFGWTLIINNADDARVVTQDQHKEAKNLVYTGMTRAKDSLHLIWPRASFRFVQERNTWEETRHNLNEHVQRLENWARAGQLQGAALHVMAEKGDDASEFVADCLASEEGRRASLSRAAALRRGSGPPGSSSSSRSSSESEGLVTSSRAATGPPGARRTAARRAASNAVRRGVAPGSSSSSGVGGPGDEEGGPPLPAWLQGPPSGAGPPPISSGKRRTARGDPSRQGRHPPPPPPPPPPRRR